MVETRRGSSSKRPLDSPFPASKRTKESEASSSTEEKSVSQVPVYDGVAANESRDPPEVRSGDLPPTDSSKPSDVNFDEKSPDVEVKVGVEDDMVVDEKEAKTAVKRQRLKKNGRNEPPAWGQLISQFSENRHELIRNSQFTVGYGRQCDLCLKDPSVSKMLCKLQRIERGASSTIKLEITGGKGAVQVNGKVHNKSSSPLTVTGGDELIFGSAGKYAYIFQQLSKDTFAASELPSSLPILEAQNAPATSKDTKARGRDSSSSAVAGASILASLSTISKRLSCLPPPRGNDEDSVMGSLSGASDNGICDVDMNDSVDLEDYNAASQNQKEVGPVSDENTNVDDVAKDTGLDTEEGMAPGSNNELKPFLQLLARSSTPDFDFSGSLSKLLDEQRQLRELLKEFDRPTFPSSRRQAFETKLRNTVLSASDIDVSLESFPYYLSETTKNVLVAAAYIPLKCSKMLKYASELPTVCPRILLSGPAGSEIYQETLAKALAKHFGVRLLVVDSILLPGGSTAKEADPYKERCKPEKASINAKRSSVVASLRHKKLASSVEADMSTGSVIVPQRPPKQEASTASSKKYTFKEGDRVKFVGSMPSGVAPLLPSRGPAYGNRGKVVLVFMENESSKIGVRFDESIPEGNNLGGRCEPDHGFFCAADQLCLENSGGDDADRLVVKEIFEAAKDVCKDGPLILFLKDMEKCMTGNPEAYMELKTRLENLPDNLIVIASHTQADSRKEKSHPGGLLFTKFGSNHTALLDLAFPGKSVAKDNHQIAQGGRRPISGKFPSTIKRLLAH